jgi:hypothetical protein
MGRAHAGALFALLSCTACGDGEASLVVELRTDYAPGADFSSVETSVEAGGVAREAIPAAAASSDDFVAGERIAQFDALPTGAALVRVALRDGDGALVATRLTRLELNGTTGLIVTISRSCAEVRCPGATDDASETECFEGRCVPPTCQPAMPETCGAGTDGGGADAGEVDGGVDAGEVDGGADAGEVDGGPADSGTVGTDGGMTDPTLVAWYRCESASPGTVPDSTGNGNHGMCSPGRCPMIATGHVGNACRFARSDLDEVRVPSLGDFAPSALTVTAWVWHQGGSEGSLIGKPVGTDISNSWQLELRDFMSGDPVPDVVLFSTAPNETGWDQLDYYFPTPPERRWIHVAGTWNGSQRQLFVDGVRELAGSGTIVSDGHHVLIGFDENDDGAGAWNHLDGLLDEIRIYSRVLSSSEIAALAAE